MPKEEFYCPPLNIRVLDKSGYGRLPVVGTCTVKSFQDFYAEPVMSTEQGAALSGEPLFVYVCIYIIAQ